MHLCNILMVTIFIHLAIFQQNKKLLKKPFTTINRCFKHTVPQILEFKLQISLRSLNKPYQLFLQKKFK